VQSYLSKLHLNHMAKKKKNKKRKEREKRKLREKDLQQLLNFLIHEQNATFHIKWRLKNCIQTVKKSKVTLSEVMIIFVNCLPQALSLDGQHLGDGSRQPHLISEP